MLAVKMSTLKENLLDNISDTRAYRIVEFAEAKCHLDTKRGTRYVVRRIEAALDFCCDHPEALSCYKTISEARKTKGNKKSELDKKV